MNFSLGRKILFLSLLSGILMTLSWPFTGGITPLALIGLVPLLLAEKLISDNSSRYRSGFLFLQAYLAFFVFNLGTTWWIYNASLFGMVGAVVLNAFFMALAFLLFHLAKKSLGTRPGYACLIFFWIAFEYLHLNWSLSWPWLTFGNVFSGSVSLIQWYEYTGVLGGTLWILAVNIAVTRLIVNWTSKAMPVWRLTIFTVFLIIGPMLWSAFIYNREISPVGSAEVVVVQPNIDPYNEKFDLSSEEQLVRMLKMAATKVDKQTDYVIFPETALPRGIWEEELEQDEAVLAIRQFVEGFDKLHYITGLSSYRSYPGGVNKTLTARQNGPDSWYDAFNTAMQITKEGEASLYHKSKLVIGVETSPLPRLKFLEDFALDLGGTTGTLGIDPERKNFHNLNGKISVAPIICYESVYGDYVTDYVKKGSTMFAIVTNDGWWGDTPGYKQHLALGQLRAIENRRAIARSANTGVSAFIDVKGEVEESAAYWTDAVLKSSVLQYNEITFYTKYGDYLGRIAAAFSVLLLVWALALRLNTTKRRLDGKRP